SPPRPCRGPHRAAASASSISPSTSSPAARQNRSKLAVTSSSARPTGDCGTPAPAVLFLVMALLAPRGFSTPSLPAQGGQRRLLFLNIDRDNPEAALGRWTCVIRECVALAQRCSSDHHGRCSDPHAAGSPRHRATFFPIQRLS